MALSSSDSTVFTVENVCVSYGKKKVLNNISLTVKAGEMFGLIGLNGAGKTSLIKAALGLRPPDSGAIRLMGLDPAAPAARQSLSFLPERFDPPWFLSGMEFLKFSMDLYGRAFDKSRIIDAAKKLALDPEALQRRVQTYSKGMRQKLGLMGALLTGCDLMILDEPMSGLDPLARARVKDLILGCKAEGRTVFLSSHILADMDEICDRVAVLHDGQIGFTGPPADFRAKMGFENLERSFLHFIEKNRAA
jgi:ABC-2 type transport system ATP-binding protein